MSSSTMTTELTPEQRALRDMWISEMWATVREYRDPQGATETVDKPAKKAA